MADIRLYIYKGDAVLNKVKLPPSTKISSLEEAEEVICYLRSRTRDTRKLDQFVVVEYFDYRESKIISINNPK